MIIQAINFCLIFVLIGILTFPAFWLYGIWDAKKTAELMSMGARVEAKSSPQQ